MSGSDPKADLHGYLKLARRVVVWKLDGLSEYDIRRPLTPTGTNLLGIVKHLAGVELGYFGDTFGRHIDEPRLDFDFEAETNPDMWATPDESRDDVVDCYRRVCAHADETITSLPLDAIGRVRWWPDEVAETTLHRILVHMIAETNRHSGHADIVRELIDGAVGHSSRSTNLPDEDAAWWAQYRARLEQAAEDAANR